MRNLVLASASPRRQELLREAGYTFTVAPADVEEDLFGAPIAADAAEVAVGLAVRKAFARAAREPGEAVVLGADTIVVAPEGDLLGKPRDGAEARAMAVRLSGRTHRVVTGIAVVEAQSGRVRAKPVESAVTFRTLDEREIDDYARGDLWRGKAGGYGVQDRPSLVADVRGSLTNVIGLPMEAIAEWL